jgi:hypothetical protein
MATSDYTVTTAILVLLFIPVAVRTRQSRAPTPTALPALWPAGASTSAPITKSMLFRCREQHLHLLPAQRQRRRRHQRQHRLQLQHLRLRQHLFQPLPLLRERRQDYVRRRAGARTRHLGQLRRASREAWIRPATPRVTLHPVRRRHNNRHPDVVATGLWPVPP